MKPSFFVGSVCYATFLVVVVLVTSLLCEPQTRKTEKVLEIVPASYKAIIVNEDSTDYEVESAVWCYTQLQIRAGSVQAHDKMGAWITAYDKLSTEQQKKFDDICEEQKEELVAQQAAFRKSAAFVAAPQVPHSRQTF